MCTHILQCPPKIFAINRSKQRGGGGSMGFWTMLRKQQKWYRAASLVMTKLIFQCCHIVSLWLSWIGKIRECHLYYAPPLPRGFGHFCGAGWGIGRVEKSKNAKNLIGYCFSNGLWSIETEGVSFFPKKDIFDCWNWTWNLGFRHFQRFLPFFLSGKRLNSYWQFLQCL